MKRTFRVITAWVLVLTLCCVTAAAAQPDSTDNRPSGFPDAGMMPQGNGDSLQVLVDEGIISQETLDAILKFMEENRPELPDGTDGSQFGTPPEKPDGAQGGAPQMPGGQKSDGMPEMPGDGQSGNMPAMPNGGGQMLMLSQEMLDQLLEAGIITQEEYDAILAFLQSAAANIPSGAPGGPGGSASSVTYTAATEITSAASLEDGVYLSDSADENTILVDTGEEVTLTNPNVTKAGDSDGGDSCNFYGLNAAVLAKGGTTLTISGGTITSDASGANGVFSYGGNGGQNGAAGDGTTVNISDTVITTSGDGSGGIMTTGGGITNASNLTVTTSGRSSAAIRTDRGGGTVNVDGGTYTSNGYNSPAVYSTAAITVKNAELTANNSEALVIEGKNSIALENCNVYGNMSSTNGASSNINVHNVMIYQSMSGDADVGTAVFTMTGGSLTSNNGDMIYVTNTHSVITLNGVELVNNGGGYLLYAAGNSAANGWGTAGANGAQVEMTADAQVLNGNIAVDSISTLSLVLKNGSSLTGTINIVENEQGGTAVSDNAVVTIGSGCTWTLTGNCTISSLTNNGTINFNGYTITLADGTVLS